MKKICIASLGLLAAVASFSAAAQLPAWYLVKHPEARTMERMQAQEKLAAKEARMKHQVALQSSRAHG